MGAALVKAAYSTAASVGLDHAPTRVFVYMALVARDDDPAPTYWGGRDDLVLALGAPVGAAGYKAVGRATHALIGAGVVGYSPGAPGRNARYALISSEGTPLTPQNAPRSAGYVVTTHPGQQGANAPRSAVERTPVSGRTHPGQRGAEEERRQKEEGVAFRDTPAPPPRTCPKHPHGSPIPCGPCGDARRAADRWKPPARRSHSCSLDGHRRVADGTCMFCDELRPEEAA